MTQGSTQTTTPIHSVSLTKRMLQGAGIALILVSMFLLSAGEPNPEWPKFWMIRPLLVVPFAGAMGGLFYYFMDHMRYVGGWRKVLAYVISFIVYVFGLWMGTVIGFAGTMWH